MGFSTGGPLVRISKGLGYATALLTLIFGISRIWDAASGYYARKAQVHELLAAAEVQRGGADYRAAWDTLEKAATVQSSPDVVHAQEDLTMEWLRKIPSADFRRRIKQSSMFKCDDCPSRPGGVAAPKAQTGWWLRFDKADPSVRNNHPVRSLWSRPPLLARRGNFGSSPSTSS